MKNIMKKFASLALVTTLFVGTQAPTALAIVDPEKPKQVDRKGEEATLTKTLELKDGISLTDQFEFKLEPVDPATVTDKKIKEILDNQKDKFEKGDPNFVKLETNKTAKKKYTQTDNQATIKLVYDHDYGQNTLVPNKLTTRRLLYKITEKGGGREGMTYDNSVKYLIVEVNNNRKNPRDKNSQYFTRTYVVNEDFTQKLGSLDFKNGYGKDPDGTPNDKVKVLKVKKEVKKPDGTDDINNTEEFTIKVTIHGQVGDIYTYDGVDYEVTPDRTDTGVSIDLKLTHGKEAIIDGLTDTDGLKIIEEKPENFDKTYEEPKGEVGKNGHFDNYGNTGNQNVTITNTKKDTRVNTGLLNNIAPFILVIGLAGVFAVIYFKKNQRELV